MGESELGFSRTLDWLLILSSSKPHPLTFVSQICITTIPIYYPYLLS